jgi:hypothetical protein
MAGRRSAGTKGRSSRGQAVSAAGVLCAFGWALDTLPGQCPRRRPSANPLVADAFRTKRLLRERCSATCPRRRRPGQARHTQGGLQITPVTARYSRTVSQPRLPRITADIARRYYPVRHNA